MNSAAGVALLSVVLAVLAVIIIWMAWPKAGNKALLVTTVVGLVLLALGLLFITAGALSR